MHKEMAQELDKILSNCKNRRHEFNSKDEAMQIGSLLEKNGHGQWISGNEIQIYPEGVNAGRAGYYLSTALHNEKINKKLDLEIAELEHKKRIRPQENIIRWDRVAKAAIGIITTIVLLFLVFRSCCK